jgi:hypothetical protein
MAECPTCQGARVVKCPRCSSYMFGKPDPDCPFCGGTGYTPCPECGGIAIDVGEGNQIDDVINDGNGKQMEDVGISLPFEWTIIGVSTVAAVTMGGYFLVKRKKVSEIDLRRLSYNEFQNWVIQRLRGKTSSLEYSRMGIDGFTTEGHPIKIVQSDSVDGNAIDTFASLILRVKEKNGKVVAFGFSDDVYRGIVRAKRNYGIEIEKVTVKELIER